MPGMLKSVNNKVADVCDSSVTSCAYVFRYVCGMPYPQLCSTIATRWTWKVRCLRNCQGIFLPRGWVAADMAEGCVGTMNMPGMAVPAVTAIQIRRVVLKSNQSSKPLMMKGHTEPTMFLQLNTTP